MPLLSKARPPPQNNKKTSAFELVLVKENVVSGLNLRSARSEKAVPLVFKPH